MATTVKQRTFAKFVAQGMAKTTAYKQAYSDRGGKPDSKKAAASNLSKKPEVAAAIEQYEREREQELLPIGDLRVVRQEMLSNMRFLARESPDHKVRLAASKMLHDICEEREDRERRRAEPVTIETLITELGEMQAPPVLELETVEAGVAEADAQAEANEAQAEAAAEGGDDRAPWEEPPAPSTPAG